MQNANTCDTVLGLFTRLDMHKIVPLPPLSRNSEPVRINANNRFEAQSVKYGAFPNRTNVVTNNLHSTPCTNVRPNCCILELEFWLVHGLDQRNTAVLQARDEEFYLLQRVQTGCVAHKSYCLISNVGALPWDNADGLLARIQYPAGPAIGHLGTGFSCFPCIYKRMLRWFPRLQVATACFSCSSPDLNFLDPYFILNVIFISYLCKCIITTATG